MRPFVVLLSLLITFSPAFAEESPDFSGAWKRDCEKNYGLKISRTEDNSYSVAFCGPSSCGGPAFIAKTPISGDPKFKIVSETEIGLPRVDIADAWLMYHRCSRDPASLGNKDAVERLQEANSDSKPK